jgi:hypothetical protein
MTIKEKEDLLFDEWSKKRDGFLEDGVVDQKAYLESNPKLMFILKEGNDPDGGDWDLRDFLKGGGRPGKTWDNVTRWIQGIRKLPEEVMWKDLEQITAEQRQEALKTVCVMNLKKSPGGHTTDKQLLWDIATEDKEFLKRQFDLYDADLIICCGTGDILPHLIDLGPTTDCGRTSRGVWYHKKKPGHFLVFYHHPAARVDDWILHYGLVDAVKEILTVRPPVVTGHGT